MLTADDFAPLFERRGRRRPRHAGLRGGRSRPVRPDDPGRRRPATQIVEARDATPEEKAVRACYSGILCAPAGPLFDWLAAVDNNNVKAEYYITSIVGIANAAGMRVGVAFYLRNGRQVGADDQAGVARAERLWQDRARAALLADGVTMTAPETVFLSFDTQIAGGVVLEPNLVFGPGVTIEGGAVIRAFSHLEGAVVRSGAIVGPYARLRPGADIGEDAHIGNFVEVKKVKVGRGAKANHLSYLGDGTIGAKANIGWDDFLQLRRLRQVRDPRRRGGLRRLELLPRRPGDHRGGGLYRLRLGDHEGRAARRAGSRARRPDREALAGPRVSGP